jgi:hypothetical protein
MRCTISERAPNPSTTPDLAFEVRKAYDRREWALELMSDLQLTPPVFQVAVRLQDDPELAAGRIREALGVRTCKANGGLITRLSVNGGHFLRTLES